MTEVESETDLHIRRVRETMDGVNHWLEANLGRPNRDATSWRIGEWNVEIGYVMGEGTLHIWHDGCWPGRKMYTRGRNDADLQLWIDALEACQP